MTQMDAYKMDGIKDLPLAVRVPFGKAWFAELNGDNEEAARLLDLAVIAESQQAAK